jgi:toxin YoeB
VKSPKSKKRAVQWTIVYTRQAVKDSKKLKRSRLKSDAEKLLDVLRQNPFQSPPPFEKLVGDLSGAYSRRINIQHRNVYQVLSEVKIIKILRMWTHYE